MNREENKEYTFEIISSTESIDFITATAHITHYSVDKAKSEDLEYTLEDCYITRGDESVVFLTELELNMVIEDEDKVAIEEVVLRAARWGLEDE